MKRLMTGGCRCCGEPTGGPWAFCSETCAWLAEQEQDWARREVQRRFGTHREAPDTHETPPPGGGRRIAA